MNITKVINEGIELQQEIDLIGERLKVYREELQQIEELFKEMELTKR